MPQRDNVVIKEEAFLQTALYTFLATILVLFILNTYIDKYKTTVARRKKRDEALNSI